MKHTVYCFAKYLVISSYRVILAHHLFLLKLLFISRYLSAMLVDFFYYVFHRATHGTCNQIYVKLYLTNIFVIDNYLYKFRGFLDFSAEDSLLLLSSFLANKISFYLRNFELFSFAECPEPYTACECHVFYLRLQSSSYE